MNARAARPFHHHSVDPRCRRWSRQLRSARDGRRSATSARPTGRRSTPSCAAAATRPKTRRTSRRGSSPACSSGTISAQRIPHAGRFRSFLLTALQHYVINEHERETTVKRGGRLHRLSLDFEEVERTYVLEARHEDSPDRVFNRKWAAISLDRALQRLRRECRDVGQGRARRRASAVSHRDRQPAAYRDSGRTTGPHRGRHEGGGAQAPTALRRNPAGSRSPRPCSRPRMWTTRCAS